MATVVKTAPSFVIAWTVALAVVQGPVAAADDIPYSTLAARIVRALQPAAGERVILRVDPTTLGPLSPELKKQLEAKGAIVESLPYGPVDNFADKLATADIYIWLPVANEADGASADQRALLTKWLDAGRGRQVHFHWNGGTRNLDGLPDPHVAAYDPIYVNALDIDYKALNGAQDRAIRVLRSGEVRVTTPAGTDLRFRVGDRPFNKQDGDASKGRMKVAKIRVDREVELPAGVLRVAPLEETVNGVLVVPTARLGDSRATGIRLELVKGVIVKATAKTGDEALQAFLKSSPALSHFRELGLGFNPKLPVPAGHTSLPYYGYGAGVVRLSLGDNTEVGGAVRGGASRWLFFDDTTITVGTTTLVKDGKLIGAS